MKIIQTIGTFIIGVVFGIIYVGTINAHTKPDPVEIPKPEIEYIYVESEPKVITETEYIYRDYPVERELTDEECDLLEQIAFAEARGEGVKGMILVMNVVLNRADNSGKSIKEVIYSPGQFYTDGMTPYVSEECHTALELVKDGVDLSQGATFFNKYGYRAGREPLFQYKNHWFTK